MPYIAMPDRPKYNSNLKSIINIINTSYPKLKESNINNPFFLGECFEHYLHILINKLFNKKGVWISRGRPKLPEFTKDYKTQIDVQNKFNSQAEEIADNLLKKPILDHVGDLNYCISYIYWSILKIKGNYSYRVYLKSIIEDLADKIPELQTHLDEIEQKMYKSVLTDVITETYRRSTASYEDQKIQENGDLDV